MRVKRGKATRGVAFERDVAKLWARRTRMGSLENDYDLLLSAPNPVEAALAKDLLAEHGIPSFTSGLDRDMAELGSGVHNAIARPDVYVPKGMRERAQAVLKEAWETEPLEDDGPGPEEPPADANDSKWSSSAEAAPVSSSPRTSWMPILAVILVVVVFVLLWAFAAS